MPTRRTFLLAGIAGALYAPLVQFVDPTPFALGLSLNLLLMVVVGGSGFYFGPILGAALVILLPEFLRVTDEYYLMIYAAMNLGAFAAVIAIAGRTGSTEIEDWAGLVRYAPRLAAVLGGSRRRQPRDADERERQPRIIRPLVDLAVVGVTPRIGRRSRRRRRRSRRRSWNAR